MSDSTVCWHCNHQLRDHVFEACSVEHCGCVGFKVNPRMAKPEQRQVLIPQHAGGATVMFTGPVLLVPWDWDDQGRPHSGHFVYDDDEKSPLKGSKVMQVYIQSKSRREL